MKDRILIINSDKTTGARIKEELNKEKKYEVLVQSEPEGVIETVLKLRPNVILLDVGFLKLSVCDVMKILRADTKTADGIVIFMSGDHTTSYDIVNGLKCGADDYVSIPFQVEVLAAKVRAHLRRRHWRRPGVANKESGADMLKSADGRITVNTGSRIVRVVSGISDEKKEYKPAVTRKEFDILVFFLENRNIVISRNHLMQNLWNWPTGISWKTVDKHVENLRNKLKSSGKKIEAIFGIGYKFNDN